MGQDNWGADSSTRALKAEATWLPFVKLKCAKDLVQERKIVQLRTVNNIDELLRTQAKFLQLGDTEVTKSVNSHRIVLGRARQKQAVMYVSFLLEDMFSGEKMEPLSFVKIWSERIVRLV